MIKQTRKIEILHRLIVAAGDAADMASLMETVLRMVLEMLGFDGGGIYLVDRKKGAAELKCLIGLPAEFADDVRRVDITLPPYRTVFLERKSIFVDDYGAFKPERTAKYGLKAGASIPFIARDGVVGSLNIAKFSPHGFTEDEKDILNSIGRETAATIVRMQSESALRESERRFKDLTDALPESVYEMDAAGTITFVNRTACDLFGYSPEEVERGIRVSDILDPPDVEKAMINLDRALKGEPLGYIEYNVRKKDGTVIPVDIISIPVTTDGAITGFRGLAIDLRERKRAESRQKAALEALRSERDFSTRLIQASPAFFVAIARDGTVITMNETMLAALGYELHETKGKKYIDTFVPEGNRRKLSEVFSVLLSAPGESVNENHVLTRDGRRLLVEWHGRSIPDSGGKVEYFFGFGIDITERRKAEAQREDALEALRQSEAKFRAVAETTDSVIYIWRNERFLYINPAAERITGYSREEILNGGKEFEIIHPEFRDFITGRVKTRLGGDRQSIRYQVKIITKAGEERWMDLSATIMEYEGLPAIVGSAFDITGNKLAESQREAALEELAAEKERLAVTLYSIGEGVITSDARGRVTMMNRTAETITGWSRAESAGKPIGKILDIRDRNSGSRLRDPLKARKTRSADFHSTVKILSRNGLEKTVAISRAPIRDGAGGLVGTVLVFRDITESLAMEQELLKSRNLESLSVLAGGIAHDFNNILTVILGNISLAKMQLDAPSAPHGLLTEAEKASQRARDLTQQLLTFSKGGAPVKKIASIAELLMDTANFSLSGSNVRAVFSIPDDLRPVKIDPGQISQVINNLVINAMHSMPAGGVIEIRAENAGGPDLTDLKPPSRTGKFVRISIRDHGMGIPPEHLPRIFDPYFTTKQKGSGLGLTTAYSIIKRHDGRISVDSKVGSGTVFTITLPATAERRRKPAREHEMITAQKGRILVMDDDLLVRSVAMEILGRLGYEAETCADGAEMIKRYTHAFGSKQPFDAVIMDLTVQGGMGGKEAINKLKAVDPAVKAIVSSGYSNDPIMSDYRKFGFSGVIGKPYTIRDMADTVRSVIGGNRKKKKS